MTELENGETMVPIPTDDEMRCDAAAAREAVAKERDRLKIVLLEIVAELERMFSVEYLMQHEDQLLATFIYHRARRALLRQTVPLADRR